MAAVLTEVLVDDVDLALCMVCTDVFAILDGWQGSCPSCCALVDEHETGRHEFVPVADCRACDERSADRLDLTAIA